MMRLLDFLGLLSYCLFIYWLSNQPSLDAPMWFAYQDKIYHAGAYFVMALLAWRCFRHWLSTPIILALLSVIFCSLYGASDEWHQSFVNGRNSDAVDWLADTFGASLAMVGLLSLGERKRMAADT